MLSEVVVENPAFALAMIVKNEQGHMRKTLDTVEEHVNTIVILDTGSTDDTEKEIREWCKENLKTLIFSTTAFVNFEVTRNELLDLAEAKTEEPFLLLLDTSDEIIGDWKQWEEAVKDPECSGIMTRQRWSWGGGDTVYLNTRIVRSRDGWRYKGVVHEYIHNTKKTNTKVVRCEEPVIFQDRTCDGGKSASRFHRDYELLLEEVQKNPTDPRSLFYLARTCEQLKKHDEALVYFARRAENPYFAEEVFWSYLSSARIYKEKKEIHKAIELFHKALNVCPRVEPLLDLVKIYDEQKMFFPAYVYAKAACELPFPHDLILFIDKSQYDYQRWHVLGIVAFYCDRQKEGYAGVLRALQCRPDSELDKRNAACYRDKFKDIK